MPSPARLLLLSIAGLTLFGQTACNVVPYSAMRQSQLRAMQLHRENVAMQQQNQQLSQELATTQSQLGVANQRIANLKNGQSKLEQRLISRINRGGGSPLNRNTTRRLKDLSGKFKNFEFDPDTGISKFHSDVLFASGSDAVRPEGRQLLREFAAIMNDPDAQKLNVLVVGHTDDKRIAQGPTRRRHPTNWHLSTNRANTVVLALKKFGIQENRLGSAGYSMFQPVTPNSNERARQANRRVEIYVLAPDAAVAGRWDPASDRH